MPSILWRDAAQAALAAEALKLTAADLRALNLVDEVIGEPLGGAHRDPAAAMEAVGACVEASLRPLVGMEAAALRMQRREKFLQMGRETMA